MIAFLKLDNSEIERLELADCVRKYGCNLSGIFSERVFYFDVGTGDSDVSEVIFRFPL